MIFFSVDLLMSYIILINFVMINPDKILNLEDKPSLREQLFFGYISKFSFKIFLRVFVSAFMSDTGV